ncbi:MAG: hypothetical protein ABIT01_07830 [Thermoanaerobaculia bacterium]
MKDPRPEGSPPAAFSFSWSSVSFGALLVLGAVALFWTALFRDEVFLNRDLWSYYLPAKSLVKRLWSESGSVPLWNPYFAQGQPFAANPEHELWHPMTALFLVLPFAWAFRLQVILPVLVAGLAMSFLQRTLGRSRFAAALGGLVWAFGGYTISTTNLLPILFAVAVLPFVLAFTLRVARGGGASDVGALALVFGLECLAGEPSTLLMTPPLLIAVLLSDRRTSRNMGSASRAILFPAGSKMVAGLALGTLLGAATLLPGLRLFGKTLRAEGLPEEMTKVWSFPLVRISELIFPRVLGHLWLGRGAYWGRSFYGAEGTPFIYSIYPGLLTAALALVAIGALVRLRPRSLAPWALVSGLGLVLALGSNSPAWRAMRAVVPILRGLRYPEKFSLLFELPLVVIAGVGFDLVLRGGPRFRRFAIRGVAALITLIASCVGTILVQGAISGSSYWSRYGGSLSMAAFAEQALRRDLAISVAFGILVIGILWFRDRRGGVLTTTRGFALALLVLLVADLVVFAAPLIETGPRHRELPRAIAQLRENPLPGPVFHAASWTNGNDPDSTFLRPPLPVYWGIPMALETDFDLTELVWSQRASMAIQKILRETPALGEPILRRRGIAAVLQIRAGSRLEGGDFVIPRGEESLELRRVASPKAFAFCAATLWPVHGEREWRDLVLKLRSGVAHAATLAPEDAASLPRTPAPCRVEIRRPRPERVELDVEAAGPEVSFLAINQTWDDLWTARLDGKTVPLLRTDLALSGVVVPAGKHRVELTYSDSFVTAGLGISVAALVAALSLILLSRRPVAGRAA